MRLDAFRALVQRFASEIPSHYLDGVVAVDVSPRTLPHPTRLGVYTLGECIPLHGEGSDILSRVVLYHGSFAALAHERGDFDWHEETRETLLHELRHHLEWRANTEALEAYDAAAEQNFARLEARPFDPLFYQAGEVLDENVFRVDDDVFIEQVVRDAPPVWEFVWRGRRYRVPVRAGPLPRYVAVDGVDDPPDGDLVLVFRSKPRLRDLFRPAREVSQDHVRAEPLP